MKRLGWLFFWGGIFFFLVGCWAALGIGIPRTRLMGFEPESWWRASVSATLFAIAWDRLSERSPRR